MDSTKKSFDIGEPSSRKIPDHYQDNSYIKTKYFICKKDLHVERMGENKERNHVSRTSYKRKLHQILKSNLTYICNL